MVGLVFSMQAAGLVVGPLIAVILLGRRRSDNAAWRLLLGFGAIPGLAVFYLRRRIQKRPASPWRAAPPPRPRRRSPRATTARGAARPRAPRHGPNRTRRRGRWLHADPQPAPEQAHRHRGHAGRAGLLLLRQHHLPPEIIRCSAPAPDATAHHLLPLPIFACCAVPGYAVAIPADRQGSGASTSRYMGFAMMASMFGLIALIPGRRRPPRRS